MKKKILSGVFALALLATAGFGVQKSMKSNVGLSDLALANVEALAQNEDGGSGEFWCSTYDQYVDNYESYCSETGRYVIRVKYTSRACNNGKVSFCYPGQVNYYYDCN